MQPWLGIIFNIPQSKGMGAQAASLDLPLPTVEPFYAKGKMM
jgi:hypothetical protein